MRRTALFAALVAAGETYFALRYAAFGALFHYWLHGLTGVAAGLAVATLVRAARPRREPRVTLLAAAVAGRLLFAAPDIAFVAFDIPHERWMDVFAGHISIHLVPAAIATSFGVFVAAVCGAAAAVAGARRSGAALAGVALVALGVAFVLRDPLPGSLDELRADPRIVFCLLEPDASVASARTVRR